MLIEVSFEENDNTKFVNASYRIRSDILMPDIITSELAIQPTRVFAKGDKYLSKTFDPETKKTSEIWRERPWGVWRIDTKDIKLSLTVEDHILYLLSLLEPKTSQINKYLNKADDYSISFYIERKPLNPSSIEISNKTLRRMSVLCHLFEFYCV